MNNHKIREKFTQIVALNLDVYSQRIEGVYPPKTDLERWRSKYIGTPEELLPPYTIEINHFKREVDQFVSMLMFALIDEQSENETKADEAT